MKKRMDARTLSGVGILTAVVIVLQLVGMLFLRFGTFSLSFVLIPIVVGAALYGVWAGAWLGFVFGVVVLISGDAAPFLTVNAIGTILTVIIKGTAAGAGSALIYHAVAKKHPFVAVVLAAIACPVLNTGVFLIGCLLFFMETVSGWAAGLGYESAGAYMILGLAGVNFMIELGVNLILSPTVVQIVRLGKRGK